MLVIENCNSLSELRQKLIDGEEVRTVRYESCGDAIRREDAINAVSEALEHVLVENEDVARKMINKLPPVNPQEPTDKSNLEKICEELAAENDDLRDQLAMKDRFKMEQIIRDELLSVNPQTKTDILDKLTGIIEPLRHLSFDEMSDVEWQILQVIDKYAEQDLKIGHWIYKIYGGFHEQGDWYCSHCDYQFNYGNGHARHCPECGYEMSEPPTEEVMSEYDRRRCNYPNDI